MHILCPPQVKAQQQFYIAIWNVTQNPLHPAHTYGLTFGNRNAPKLHLHFMTCPLIQLYLPMRRKSGVTAKHLQKPASVQGGIPMKPSQARHHCQDKQSGSVVLQLG